MHPDTKTLLAYRDGELNTWRMEKTSQHLLRCAPCRHELHLMEVTLQCLQSTPVPSTPELPDLEAGLQALLARTRKLGPTPRTAVLQKLEDNTAAQVEEFFGSRTMASVRSARAAGEGAGVLPTAELLFSAFLGRRAAAELASCIFEGVELAGEFAPAPAQ